jgi:outer membrane protein assembly factor BamB
VRSGVLVRERCCPACAATVRVRDARWCGTCGELLEPVAVEAPSPTRSPWRHRLLIGTAGAAILAVAVVTGGGVIDRTAARSAAVQDLAVATPDADVLDGLERAPRPTPPVVEEPTCTRTGDRACFLWTTEVDGAGFSVATVAGDVLITQDAYLREIVARDLADGTVAWSVDLAGGGRPRAGLLSARELVLHVEGEDLVARELATGAERWRTGELGRLLPWQAHPTADQLVVVGEDVGALESESDLGQAVASGLDPGTGELSWQRSGTSASLAAGGVTVVTTADDHLAAYTPTGELLWRAEEPSEAGAPGAWAHGHVISVYDEDTGVSELHRLSDGAPLGFDGYPVATDDQHTLVQLHGSVEVDGTIVLLDGAGEAWRIDGADWSDCVAGAGFTAATVELTTCRRGQVTLDRADGSVLERRFGDETPTSVGYVERVGPYEIVPTEVDGLTRDVLVAHAESGRELARLPPETWPVWPQEPTRRAEFGDVVVLQSHGWLSALPLPGPSVVGGARTQ